jgi:hypothetical protein
MRMEDPAQALGNVLPQATTAGLSLRDVGDRQRHAGRRRGHLPAYGDLPHDGP